MKDIEDSRAGPYDACTGIARGTRWVLRIIQPNHKYAYVSGRTGAVPWCDHRNSTDVKFLRALHSALWGRNPTGDKNRTGSVVGSDWGITAYSALSIHCGPVSQNDSWETHIARPSWRGVGFCREFEVWSKFYFEVFVMCGMSWYIVPQYIKSL